MLSIFNDGGTMRKLQQVAAYSLANTIYVSAKTMSELGGLVPPSRERVPEAKPKKLSTLPKKFKQKPLFRGQNDT